MDIWDLANWAADRLQQLWQRLERAALTGEGSVLPGPGYGLPPADDWQDTQPDARRGR
jgi:hypothetical protein